MIITEIVPNTQEALQFNQTLLDITATWKRKSILTAMGWCNAIIYKIAKKTGLIQLNVDGTWTVNHNFIGVALRFCREGCRISTGITGLVEFFQDHWQGAARSRTTLHGIKRLFDADGRIALAEMGRCYYKTSPCKTPDGASAKIQHTTQEPTWMQYINFKKVLLLYRFLHDKLVYMGLSLTDFTAHCGHLMKQIYEAVFNIPYDSIDDYKEKPDLQPAFYQGEFRLTTTELKQEGAIADLLLTLANPPPERQQLLDLDDIPF